MFNPGSDLNAIQKILTKDAEIMKLMDLTGPAMNQKIKEYIKKFPHVNPSEVEDIITSEHIIKRSQWDGLATNEKRLCIYFVPDRRTRNENVLQGIYEVDIHLPISQDFKAWKIQERVKLLLHKKKVNRRYSYFEGQLGELPTMKGFFCCGSRFSFSRVI